MIDQKAFLDAIPLPALTVDSDDRISQANTQALTLIGQGLIGRNYVTMLRQPALLDAIEGTLRDRQPRTTQYATNDGAHDITYNVTCRFVDRIGWMQEGTAVVCFEDITPFEQTSRMRRDFVANVSHELRTPLTAIMGFIETLRGPAKTDARAQDRFLGIMEGEAARMNRLIDDLLSLSRVEQTQRVKPSGHVNLVDILTSTIASLDKLAEEHAMQINFDAAHKAVTLQADADQLRQVFGNLIENALKYANEGKRLDIALTTSDKDASLRAPAARITFTDHGAGIASHHLPRLTERFYRADTHRGRDQGGTGLGLAIVKHIINRHRGRLRIQSEQGQGVTVTVILPI